MRGRMLIAMTLAVALAWGAAKVSAAQSSEQIVFSGIFPPGTSGPGGFWIWCESEDSSNPYAGFCNGAMYFYALGITEHVTGTVEEIAEGQYTMDVSSPSLDCSLTNSLPLKKGPKNTVTVSCNVGDGTSTNAVVNVTGP